jgi:uncharacterized protein
MMVGMGADSSMLQLALLHVAWLAVAVGLGLVVLRTGHRMRLPWQIATGILYVLLSLPAFLALIVFWPFDFLGFSSETRLGFECNGLRFEQVQTPGVDFYDTRLDVTRLSDGKTVQVFVDGDDTKVWGASIDRPDGKVVFSRWFAGSERLVRIDLQQRLVHTGLNAHIPFAQIDRELDAAPPAIRVERATSGPDHLFFITLGVLVIAFLYSSVGHAGASGYIAVMSLFSMAPAVIKPTALTLNILVATIGAFQFWRAGHFSWRVFWPFALLSAPCAFLGGYMNLPTAVFKIIVGLILLYSAWRFFVRPPADVEPRQPSFPVALGSGAGLGLLSGLTGTGGGIFLTPLLIFMHWARTKTASAVSACFILVNSIAGLAGNVTAAKSFPGFVAPMIVAAVAGGTAGSYLGSRRFSPMVIKRLLAVVLVLAGFKLILTG